MSLPAPCPRGANVKPGGRANPSAANPWASSIAILMAISCLRLLPSRPSGTTTVTVNATWVVFPLVLRTVPVSGLHLPHLWCQRRQACLFESRQAPSGTRVKCVCPVELMSCLRDAVICWQYSSLCSVVLGAPVVVHVTESVCKALQAFAVLYALRQAPWDFVCWR